GGVLLGEDDSPLPNLLMMMKDLAKGRIAADPVDLGPSRRQPVLNPENAALIDRAVRRAAPTPPGKIPQPRRRYPPCPGAARPARTRSAQPTQKGRQPD